jgi:hypothetical protein
MKCPKCSYISFDYNLTCPKCDKDISSEQEKLHLPSFRPNPPFLLGALTGEVNDSHLGQGRGSSEISMGHDAEVTLEDESSHFDSGEVAMPESSEFDLGSEEISLDDTSGLSLDSGRSIAPGKGTAEEIVGKDLDTEEAIAELDLEGAGDDELSLDANQLELGDPEGAAPGTDELSLEPVETQEDDNFLAAKSPNSGEGKGVQAKSEPETMELDLESESSAELDKLLDMDEIRLEEVPISKAGAGNKKATGKKPGASSENDLSLDLGDLDLELDLGGSKAH